MNAFFDFLGTVIVAILAMLAAGLAGYAIYKVFIRFTDLFAF